MERERHGFVTFWLFLLIVVHAIVGIRYFVTYSASGEQTFLYLGLLSIAAIAAPVLLLCWQKIGFWLFLVTQIAIIVLIYTAASAGLIQIQSSGVFGLNIIILWRVLKLEKDGNSAWDYMSGKTVLKKPVNKKCRQCGNIYSVYLNACPKCGSSLYEESSQETTSLSQLKDTTPLFAPVAGDTWVCKNCNEVNRSTASLCKGCGEYR